MFNTLYVLSGVQQHTSVVCRPRGNGRAETAVRLTIERVSGPEGNTWVHKLPLTMYYLNDIPRAYTPYSPHCLVFGRTPIGLGEVAPIDAPLTCVDAESWHDRHRDLCVLLWAKGG